MEPPGPKVQPGTKQGRGTNAMVCYLLVILTFLKSEKDLNSKEYLIFIWLMNFAK